MGYWALYSPTTLFEGVLEDVWDLYVAAYADIGLIIKKPEILLEEYDRWAVHFDDAAVPNAFWLAKSTPAGVKAGLLGAKPPAKEGTPEAKDYIAEQRSAEGRAAIRDRIPKWFDAPGNYGEVSHRMETLSKRFNLPAVCAVDARHVLGKTIEILPDGLHYKREIVHVGMVTKIMVGRPRGVLTMPLASARCTVDPTSFDRRDRHSMDHDLESLLAHFSNFLVV